MDIVSNHVSEPAIGLFGTDGALVWRNAVFAQRFGSLETPAEMGVSYLAIMEGLVKSGAGHSQKSDKDRWTDIMTRGASQYDVRLTDGGFWRMTETHIPANAFIPQIYASQTEQTLDQNSKSLFDQQQFGPQLLCVAHDISHLSRSINSRELALNILRHSLEGSHWRTGLEHLSTQLSKAYGITRFILFRLEGDPDAGPSGAIKRIAIGYDWQRPDYCSGLNADGEHQHIDTLDNLRWSDLSTLSLPETLHRWLRSSIGEGAIAIEEPSKIKLPDLIAPLPMCGAGSIAPIFVDERPWGAICVVSSRSPDTLGSQLTFELKETTERLGLILSFVIQSMFNQDRLVSLKSEADEQEATRNKFLAQVSHEIRTPLQGLIGALDLAGTEIAITEAAMSSNDTVDGNRAEIGTPELKSLINVANRSSADLLTVVNDVLDYSRLQSNHFTLTPTWTNPNALLDSVGELFHAAAREKGLDLGLAYEELPIGDWWLDQQRVRQILVNFLENAIKYTKLGGILISVKAGRQEPGDPGDSTPIEFSISDTGPGMSEEAQRTAFDAFTRSENETARRAPGTGLGLEICARLGAAMGGYVSVDSIRGQGSTFTLRLAERMRPSFGSCALREALAGRHCFVIAPKGEMRRGLVRTLRGVSAVVNIYDSLSSDLLEDLESSGVLVAADYIFIAPRDAAFIHQGLQQPSRKGRNSNRHMRSDANGGRSHVRQNWQTVRAKICILPFGPEDDSLGLERPQGSFQCRSPLSWRNLEDVICGPQSSVQIAASGPLFDSPIHLLLAEDSKTNQMTISAMLRLLGIEATVADNGQHALSLFRDNVFDLVLMDIQMPIMDGLEACAACKRIEGKSEIPIIALTGSVLDEVRQACRLAGMDGFLTKPTRINELRDMLLYWLDPERASSETQSIISMPPTQQHGQQEDKTGFVDLEALQQRHLELGDTGLKKVVTVFVHETDDRVKAIRSAMAKQDFKAVAAHAHTIKSASQSFGLIGFPDLALNIEEACKRGDAQKVESLTGEFVSTLPNAMRKLSSVVMDMTATSLDI